MALGIPSYSPGVQFREIDITGSVGNSPTSTAVISGNFNWGPVAVPVLVGDEEGLVSTFSRPDENNTVDFHSASYFLKYSDGLYVIREVDGDSALSTTAKNAHATVGVTTISFIPNRTAFDNILDTIDNFSGDSDGDPNLERGHSLVARYPGEIGNSLEVQVCNSHATDSSFDNWEYKNTFDAAPGTSSYVEERDGSNDEIHVVVVDKNGRITGTKGTVLETYPFVSLAKNARKPDGSTNYVANVINDQSSYIYWVSAGSSLAFDSDEWGLASNIGTNATVGVTKNFGGSLSTKTFTFNVGANSGALSVSDHIRAFDRVEDAETTDVDILVAPGLTATDDQKTMINDLASIAGSVRRDAVAVSSPPRNTIVGTNAINSSTITNNIVSWANSVTSSSYVLLDNNYLKVYDKYNDNYIQIPAASSTAGLMAATDRDAAPWYSPAGSRRGLYLGVTDLAWNPETKTNRDTLYKAGVNPIVNIVGQGPTLYGDKTKLGRPSAFDRVNVRRLFLKLEKDITEYAKNLLFEFNDEFTRAEFVGVVEPYLRDVKARRGIYDYKIVCDETNNPPSVVDANEFIASIFVKPARSINYITLNFVAVRSGVSFEEVVGTV